MTNIIVNIALKATLCRISTILLINELIIPLRILADLNCSTWITIKRMRSKSNDCCAITSASDAFLRQYQTH